MLVLNFVPTTGNWEKAEFSTRRTKECSPPPKNPRIVTSSRQQREERQEPVEGQQRGQRTPPVVAELLEHARRRRRGDGRRCCVVSALPDEPLEDVHMVRPEEAAAHLQAMARGHRCRHHFLSLRRPCLLLIPLVERANPRLWVPWYLVTAKVHGEGRGEQGEKARHLPHQAGSPRRRPSPWAATDEAVDRAEIRDPGAPRPQPPLGSPARTRRRARLLGPPQGPPGDPGEEPPRRPHRGPSPGVRDLRGRDPPGRVRGRPDDDLGLGPLRRGEVVRFRGQVRAPRAEGRRQLRALPDQGSRLDDPPARHVDPGRPSPRLRQTHAGRRREAPGRRARAGPSKSNGTGSGRFSSSKVDACGPRAGTTST